MAMYVIFIIFCFLIFLAQECHTVSLSDVSDEIVKLTAMYNGKTSVIPLQNQSNAMSVLIGMQLRTFNGFDDIAGVVDISAYLKIEWTEERYSNTSRPDALVTVSAASIWKPPLILVNAAGTNTDIVHEQSLVNINLTSGKSEWTENVKLQGSCRPNVSLYPVDVHDCAFHFTSRAYNSGRLNLKTSSFDPKTNFINHVAWTVEKTYTTTFLDDSKSYAEFHIKIQRRSKNIVLIYILPTGILSVLNVFVFILPRRSRERAGYSVTCFLAFAVFMNTIVTTLPKSSEPIAVLVEFLTGMMIINTIITITALCTLMIEKRVNDVKEQKENHQRDNGNTIPNNNDIGRNASNNNTSNHQNRPSSPTHVSLQQNGVNTKEGTSNQGSIQTNNDENRNVSNNETSNQQPSPSNPNTSTISQKQNEDNKEEETSNQQPCCSKSKDLWECNYCLPNRVSDISSYKQIPQKPPGFLSCFARICRCIVRFFFHIFRRCCYCCSCRCCILPKDDKLGWIEVGNTLDVFFFIFFISLEVLFTVSLIAPISRGYFANKPTN